MGHASSKELSQSKSLILEVVPLNDELGRDAYGLVFTVRYVCVEVCVLEVSSINVLEFVLLWQWS